MSESLNQERIPAINGGEYVNADEAPLGTIVQIGRDTPDERIARAEFHRYLFQYFEQLTSGQTGWGVDFNAWLEMTQGWKHHGRKKYERVMSIGEMIDSEPSVGTPTEK